MKNPPQTPSEPTASPGLLEFSWPKFWDKAVIPQTREFALEMVTTCHIRRLIMEGALRRARQELGVLKARRLARRYLVSFPARLDALVRSFERKIGPVSKLPTEDLLRLVHSAGALSPWNPIIERSVALPMEKRGGGIRWTHRHGMFLYALELLTVGAATQLATLLPTQFLSAGGIPKFSEWLRKKLPKAKLVLTADIPGCFDNIKWSSVEDNLNLPKQVVEKVLLKPMRDAIYLTQGYSCEVPEHGPYEKASATGKGIPQGSALSQLASEIVIACVLRSVSELGAGVQVASHGDNLVFLIEDVSLEASLTAALVSSISEHFGDDTAVALACRIERRTPAQGFQFCRRHYRFKGGKFSAKLPVDYIDEFTCRKMIEIGDAYDAKSDEKFGKLERSLKSWMYQNVKTKGAVDAAADLLAHLKFMRK